jgi:transcriptional regulator with XRE-family HTH domain
MVDYSLKIKELRKFLALTQGQLAADLGVSRSIISQIEIGKFKPTLESLTDIARIYNIDANYFFNEDFLLSIGTSNTQVRKEECRYCIEKERLIKSLETTIVSQEKTIQAQDKLLKVQDPGYKQTASG